MTRIPELEQELVAAATRLRSPRRVLGPARVALAAAAVAVVAILLVLEATDKDHGRRAGTPPSQRGPKVGIDVDTSVRFNLEGRQLTVTLLPSAHTVIRNRVSGARIRATCGADNAEVGPEGNLRDTSEERTRFWPAGQDTSRFRFRGDISSSNANWCRVDNPAVGYVGFVRFGEAPVRDLTLFKRNQTGITQTANKWARLFAASAPGTCREMTQPACEREDCEPLGAIANCTLPSSEFRESFRDASVEKIVIRGQRAAAMFTNGEAVELFNPRRADFWLVDKFGENAGRGFFKDTTAPPLSPEQRIEQTANKWARLFATSDPDTCHLTMNQPACERASCTRNDPTDPPIRNCTLPSAEYRKSFRDASVEKIAIRGQRAAARFTNGEAVGLFRPEAPGDVWLVARFGENAGRGFFK